LLIDFHGVNQKVRLGHVLRIEANKIHTGIVAVGAVVLRTCSLAIVVARKIPAEVDVEDDFVILEFIIDNAIALEICRRQSKVSGIGRAARYTRWNRLSREEPYADPVGSPLHRIDPSTIGVKSCAIADIRWCCTTTANIVPRIISAIVCRQLTKLCTSSNRAVDTGV